MTDNIHCKKRNEIDAELHKTTISLEEINQLIKTNRYKEKLKGKKYTDLCENNELNVLDVIAIPFNADYRSNFISIMCNNDYSTACHMFESKQDIKWVIECVNEFCDGKIPSVDFSCQRLDYVLYCLGFSSE